ncbi:MULTISPECIES: hypothetical protein [unclassified Providencia]|uniref:hypothetical protein n=1 Tax=unclassified Providencia TaxID=2633465 RepID=UPI0012B5A9B9|nr:MULTISPECIES: hypothetical protein [unclassified Providencia]MTC21804.1 hypothetical protein [Providencia sp. wls1938]
MKNVLKSWILVALLVGFAVEAKETEKDFFIEMVDITCEKHEDPEFCKWNIENISAITSINTMTYYRCKLEREKSKECIEADESFNYIQNQYDKNMLDSKKK